MHVLFVHRNFPAQFGHIARRLIEKFGWRCTFVSETPAGTVNGIQKIQYKIAGGATPNNHYCSRTFENAVWHAHAVYEAVRTHDVGKPDLIVGHSGFGSTLFLSELFDAPIVNFFEYYYRGHGTDMDFRPDMQPRQIDFLRSKARNAMILLDLEQCHLGYTPTRFQKRQFPRAFEHKLDVIFDGVDLDVWQRDANVAREVGGRAIDSDTRIVTYVARGFESMRGFDIFMHAAHVIMRQYPNTIFVVVGSDEIHYGGDRRHIKEKSFKEHVLATLDVDLSRFLFTGTVTPAVLAKILSLSDLHIYLTVPFVLSWSMMNALACGCVVLASDTEPVREIIEHERTGLLTDFFDVDGLAAKAVAVLRAPKDYRHLGDAGTALIREQYALDVTIPKLVRLYERAMQKRR